MHLIMGGRYMGKLNYAKSLYGEFKSICDLERENLREAELILNLHFGVKNLLEKNMDINVTEFFMKYNFKNSVLIGDEINSGVIPLKYFDRKWREETGKLYYELAKNADIVDRVWSGLALRLKG